MDTASAFAMDIANRDKPLMVFDWDKAAQLIAERKPTVASAGLAGIWEYTGGDIYSDGKPVPIEETYTFLTSTWATPSIYIDGVIIDCFRLQDDSPGWSSNTYWPESAVAILSGADASATLESKQ